MLHSSIQHDRIRKTHRHRRRGRLRQAHADRTAEPGPGRTRRRVPHGELSALRFVFRAHDRTLPERRIRRRWTPWTRTSPLCCTRAIAWKPSRNWKRRSPPARRFSPIATWPRTWRTRASRVAPDKRGEFLAWLRRLEYEIYGLPGGIAGRVPARAAGAGAAAGGTQGRAHLHHAKT